MYIICTFRTTIARGRLRTTTRVTATARIKTPYVTVGERHIIYTEQTQRWIPAAGYYHHYHSQGNLAQYRGKGEPRVYIEIETSIKK